MSRASGAKPTGMRLYGFLTRDERRAFVLLQTIQGVGPKAALAVLDVLPPGRAGRRRGARATRPRSPAPMASGPSSPLRIVTELKDKPIGDGVGRPRSTPATRRPPPATTGRARRSPP